MVSPSIIIPTCLLLLLLLIPSVYVVVVVVGGVAVVVAADINKTIAGVGFAVVMAILPGKSFLTTCFV